MADFLGFSLSIIGAGHMLKKTACQDNSAYYCDDKAAIAVVADGHGSEKHFRSDVGSKLAVQVAIASIKEFITHENDFINKIETDYHQVLNQLEKYIILKWNGYVKQHHSMNSLLENELTWATLSLQKDYLDGKHIEAAYGTTLIIAVMTKKYCFGMQVGDGDFIAVNENGTCETPIPKDEGQIANITTSLCNSDAIDNFRHFFSNNLPFALVVSSDGVRNSFKSDEAFLKFIQTVTESFKGNEYDMALEQLKEFLPKLSREGSGDDVSIACVYLMDKRNIDEANLPNSERRIVKLSGKFNIDISIVENDKW